MPYDLPWIEFCILGLALAFMVVALSVLLPRAAEPRPWGVSSAVCRRMIADDAVWGLACVAILLNAFGGGLHVGIASLVILAGCALRLAARKHPSLGWVRVANSCLAVVSGGFVAVVLLSVVLAAVASPNMSGRMWHGLLLALVGGCAGTWIAWRGHTIAWAVAIIGLLCAALHDGMTGGRASANPWLCLCVGAMCAQAPVLLGRWPKGKEARERLEDTGPQ